jgi:predicted SAM-dependent methyltransferase
MQLEFGGGESPRTNYTQLDVRPLPGIDYICKAWEITEYLPRESVTDIYSRHFLEHLTYDQLAKTLAAWYYILKPTGQVEIIVPDLRFHIDQFLTRSNLEWAIEGIWGKQREVSEGEVWDIHKSGYDFDLLKDILEEADFKHITRCSDLPKNLRVVAIK